LKTYFTVRFYSEGAGPIEVVERLRSVGFKVLRGYHNHVYDWRSKKAKLEDILRIANSVHETPKGFKVLYKLETE
jgi:hypothetical protein